MEDQRTYEYAIKHGCNPEWVDGLFGFAWHCTCPDNRHGIDSQCSMIMAEYTDAEKEKLIAEAFDIDVDEERLKIANSLVETWRCGGMEYEKIAHIRYGGYLYPDKALKAARALGDEVAVRWMEQYRKLNNEQL